MEHQDNWKTSFSQNLKKYLSSLKIPGRSALESFQTQSLETIFSFLQKFYQIILSSHSQIVNTLCISPDSSILATGSKDSTVRLWCLKSSSQIISFDQLGSEVNSVKFTETGHKLLIGLSNATIQLMNLQSYTIEHTFRGQTGGIREICIIPCTTHFISASYDINLVIWNYSTYKCEAFLRKHQKTISCLAVSPCGKYAASGSCDKKFVIWNIQSFNSKKVSKEFQTFVDSIEFSSDSKFLILSTGNSIVIHNIEDSIEYNLDGHTCKILRIVDLRNAHELISVSYDKTVRLWNLNTRSQTWSVSLAPFFSNNFVYDKRRNKVIAGLNKGQVMELDLLSVNGDRKCMPGHNKEIFLVAISPDFEVLASTSWDCVLIVWDLRGKKIIGSECKVNESINCMEFSHDSRFLATGFGNAKIEIWEVRNFKNYIILTSFQSPITALKYYNEACLISCTNNCEIQFWNIEKCLSHNFAHTTASFCTKVRLLTEKYMVCQFKSSIIKVYNISQQIKNIL